MNHDENPTTAENNLAVPEQMTNIPDDHGPQVETTPAFDQVLPDGGREEVTDEVSDSAPDEGTTSHVGESTRFGQMLIWLLKTCWIPVVIITIIASAGLIIRSSSTEAEPQPLAISLNSPRVQICPGSDEGATLFASARTGSIVSGKLGQTPAPHPQPYSVAVDTSPVTVLDSDGIPAVAGVYRSSMIATWAGCDIPRSDVWIQVTDAIRSTVTVVNPSSQEATVNLELYGPSGEIVSQGAAGIAIPAGQSRQLPISVLAPVNDAVAVHLTTTGGSVAVFAVDIQALWKDYSSPLDLGKTLVIPPLPAGAVSTKLHITNPHPDRINASVHVLADTGKFAPAGAEAVSIPAKSTVTVDISAGMTGRTGAIEIEADRDIVASATVESGSDGTRIGARLPFTVGQQTSVEANGVVLVSNLAETQAPVVVSVGTDNFELAVPAGTTVSVPVPEAGKRVNVFSSASIPLAASLAWTSPGLVVAPIQPMPAQEDPVPLVLTPPLR